MKPDDTPDNFWPEVCTYTLSNLAKKDQAPTVIFGAALSVAVMSNINRLRVFDDPMESFKVR